MLTSKYCASCRLFQKLKSYHINFLFLLLFFYNQVGVIEIFLVCLVGELCFSGKRV